MVTTFSSRAYFCVSALIMLAGSYVMFHGGIQHPMISDAMGPLGSPMFYHHFAEMMVDIPNWRSLHAQIMVGPILWAIGGIGLAAWLRRKGERLWTTSGIAVTAMGGLLWIVTYMGDGFVSARIAPHLLAATDPQSIDLLTSQFQASQELTITLCTPAWLLIAGGTLLTAIGMVSTFLSSTSVIDRTVVTVLGATGDIAGVWPVIAYMTGTFEPGPMLSPWWAATATGMQIWYGVAALWMAARQIVPAAPAARRNAPTVETAGGPVRLTTAA